MRESSSGDPLAFRPWGVSGGLVVFEPFVALGVEEALRSNSRKVNLDERYFDTTALSDISLELRQEVALLVNRATPGGVPERRRSERIPQSLVAPVFAWAPDSYSQVNPFQS